MKAFVLNKYSKTAQLQLTEVPLPVLSDDDVLVEIHAAGLNLLDSKIKSGEFKPILPYKLPLIMGHDLAGIVMKTGKNVRRFKVGDEVYTRPSDFRIGTFAEQIAVNEADLALKPKNINMEEAASLPLVSLTAWQALVENGKIEKGQKVFIQAGSGGVGTIAIQLAKHLGATVATTASARNFDLLKGLGADVLIDYKNQDFENVLNNYDLVINSQDKKTLEKSINILQKGGKVISISGPPTAEFARSIKAPWFIRLFLSILSGGILKRAKKQQVDYQFLFMHADGIQLAQITKLVEAGAIKPVIDKVFPFEEANDALAYVESGRATGKVLIKIK
jgi:2-desacetyl-2-hydroxyethyl bacteriochlorophyllide A dehydrogenase